jgi:hypothetical protein
MLSLHAACKPLQTVLPNAKNLWIFFFVNPFSSSTDNPEQRDEKEQGVLDFSS